MAAAPKGHNFTGKLSKFVNRVINTRRLDPSYETNLYDYAEDFLRDLNSDTFPRLKEYRADPEDIENNLIKFPGDMIGWGKIGYESSGQVVPYGVNDNLAFNSRIELTPDTEIGRAHV